MVGISGACDVAVGRYRALLCLVQIAVDEDNSDGAGPHI